MSQGVCFKALSAVLIQGKKKKIALTPDVKALESVCECLYAQMVCVCVFARVYGMCVLLC